MTGELFVKDIMSKPVTISKSAAITEALDKMLDGGLDPLIVMNNNSVVGTVSRRAMAEVLGSKKNSNLSPAAIHVSGSVEEDFTTVYPDQDLDVLVPLLQAYKLVVVYDEDHRLIGQVTYGDLLKVNPPDGTMDEVMEPACTIDIEERVVHLRRRMLDDSIYRFVVTDCDRVVGIITETDVAIAMRNFREVVETRHQDHRVRNLLVKDIMTTPVITVERTAKVPEVVDLMLARNISSIPVIDGEALCGMVTRASMIKSL